MIHTDDMDESVLLYVHATRKDVPCRHFNPLVFQTRAIITIVTKAGIYPILSNQYFDDAGEDDSLQARSGRACSCSTLGRMNMTKVTTPISTQRMLTVW